MTFFNHKSRDYFKSRYCNNNNDTIEDVANQIEVNSKVKGFKKFFLKGYFSPATPILHSRLDVKRGLPISCFLTGVQDDLASIATNSTDMFLLCSKGGGVGTNWSKIRSVGQKVGTNGVTAGIMPFLKIQDALTGGISQGSVRRGSGCGFLSIYHDEIGEFIRCKDHASSSGDHNRLLKFLTIGVLIDDAFLTAVSDNSNITTINGNSVNARDLYIEILKLRVALGMPYFINMDACNDPKLNDNYPYKVETSNLCTEIMMRADENHTGVCCLGSLNIELFDEYKDNLDEVVEVLFNLLRNTLEITRKELQRIYMDQPQYRVSVQKVLNTLDERNIGIGAMGLFSYFMKHKLSMEHDFDQIRELNHEIFSKIKVSVDKINKKQKNPSNLTTAIAPTSSISLIVNQTTPTIEPYNSTIIRNISNSDLTEFYNPYLVKAVNEVTYNEKQRAIIWNEIAKNDGELLNCKHLPLSDAQRAIYVGGFEIDQKKLMTLAGDRQAYINQGQSINMFLRPDISAKELVEVHRVALVENRLKSLYYVRSTSTARSSNLNKYCDITNQEECEACQ